jgi:antitoxin MazE
MTPAPANTDLIVITNPLFSSFPVLTLCVRVIAAEDAKMEVAIRKMGNSQGVLIPKPILAQVGLEGTADLQVRDGVIEIRPIRRNPREGWAKDAERLAQEGEDALVWPELANQDDDDLVW